MKQNPLEAPAHEPTESPLGPFNPAQVVENLRRAFEEFCKDYPDIPREEALRMWRAAGG